MTSKTPAEKDYEAKVNKETSPPKTSHRSRAAPEPSGDPLSGVLLVVGEDAISNAAVVALRRSLAAVGLSRAYVAWPSSRLPVEVLSVEPAVLVAVGPSAADAIDALNYPLARESFSEAPEGAWFDWSAGTRGLRLPALGPALEDADDKRRFWRAFVALRTLTPGASLPS